MTRHTSTSSYPDWLFTLLFLGRKSSFSRLNEWTLAEITLVSSPFCSNFPMNMLKSAWNWEEANGILRTTQINPFQCWCYHSIFWAWMFCWLTVEDCIIPKLRVVTLPIKYHPKPRWEHSATIWFSISWWWQHATCDLQISAFPQNNSRKKNNCLLIIFYATHLREIISIITVQLAAPST